MSVESVDQIAYNLRLVDIAEEPKKLLLPIGGYEKLPLVTLEEAIEPIAHLLPDIKQKVHIAIYNSENPKGGLTVDLSAAIMLYTMGKISDNKPLYYLLNSILRSKESDRSEQLQPWFLYLKLFITALSHLPSYRGTVYRGVKCDMSDYYTIGKKFVWWGFSSCTKSLGVLQSELFLGQQGVGTLFIIECFSGKEIRHYSQYEKEDEVLLVAARQFIVVDRLNPKAELWIIQVKEIDPPFPFLKTESSISSTLEMTRPDNTDPINICSKITSDAETSTDDLPYRIEEYLSNEKLNVNTAETSTDDLPYRIEGYLSNEKRNVNSAETSTDDLPYRFEEHLSNEKRNVNSAETSTDDLPYRIEEYPSNEKRNINSTENEEDTSVLINSATTKYSNSDPSDMFTTTANSNTFVSAEPVKGDLLVKTLTIRNQLITEESAKILAEDICQNTGLEILYLLNNGLKDSALRHIIQSIIDRTSVKVFIRDNSITDESAASIAEVLYRAPKAISQLRLEKNRLTAQGVQFIVQSLLNTPDSALKSLSFSGNRLITDACIDDVIQLFNETQILKSLYLDHCNLSAAGKEYLRLSLINKPGFFLQL